LRGEHLIVAVIDPVGIKAGMDHYDLLLLKGIHEAGAVVRLYSNFTSDISDFNSRKVFFNTGVSKMKAILSNFSGFFKALRDAKKNKVQWLLLHVFRAGMFDLCMFSIARLMGFKICAIVHDIESLDTYSLPFVRKTVTGRLPHVRIAHNDFSRKELVLRTGKSSDRNTFVIPHVNFTDLFPADKTKVIIVSDPQALDPSLTAVFKDNIPVFVFFGQIKRAKGIDVLLEALCQVKGECKLIIAGRMREDNWRRYQQMIRALNLQHKVVPVIRFITDQERDYLFRHAAAVVLPYHKIYQSGVLLMAMSFPALVIASDLPPNRDIVKDNQNGMLFKAGSSPDLARRIQEVLEGASDSSAMRQTAREDVEKRFGYRKVGQDYYNLLTGLG
jgi:glycosyltransferase involved in cell wall biosynthesis